MCDLQVFTNSVWQVIKAVKGIVKFSLGTDKTKDAQSDFDTGIQGLKIDFLNLVPTWSLLNRSTETFNPLGARRLPPPWCVPVDQGQGLYCLPLTYQGHTRVILPTACLPARTIPAQLPVSELFSHFD